MTVYADTSWWIACKIRGDVNHAAALRLFDLDPEARVVWTPWHRIEVFNSLRQAERHGVVKSGEARQTIHALEREIRLGYFPHVEFDWTDTARTASELSAEHSLSMACRAMDLFHVAIAIEVAADRFVSFDSEQVALAEASGLKMMF